MDWNVIKAEYIAGGTSYRKLAEKYNVSFNTIQGIAKQEKWVELRNQAKDKSTTKMVNSIAKGIAKNAVKINTVADKLLDKIIKLLEAKEAVDSQTIKQCTSALKDIKDIKGIKSEIDLKEQEARIDKLRKDIEADKPSEDKPCGVVVVPKVMDVLAPPSEGDGADV